MPELDPFASVGVSSVFFKMVLGKTNPKQIADSLETSPPTVMGHLHRLKEIGVKLGRKEGKEQHYEIDWGRFARAFLQRSYTLSLLRSSGKKEELEEMKRVMEELGKSEGFRELLKRYLEKLAENMERGLYPQRTLWGIVYGFEDSLEVLPRLKVKLGEKGRGLAELLEVWDRHAKRFRSEGPSSALEKALLEVGRE